METIRAYIENMFAAFPRTERVLRMKSELMTAMEDKYSELKAQGRSEHEAVGTVISEFGSIEEVKAALGIGTEGEKEEPLRMVTRDEAERFLRDKETYGRNIAVAVMLFILAPAILILVTALMGGGDDGGLMSVLGLIPFFLLVAAGVGICIYTGMQSEKYKYMEQTAFFLPPDVSEEISLRRGAFMSRFTVSMIAGVTLCLLSPLGIIIVSVVNEAYATYAVVLLLGLVAAAVHLFIFAGSVKESFDILLQIGEYTKSRKTDSANKIIGAVAGVVWPVAVCVFLIWGFFYRGWSIAWIVFPITGILFGAFSAIVRAVSGKNETEPSRRAGA